MWYSSSWRVWPIHRLSAECYVPPLLKYDQLWGEAQHWCEAAQHQEPVCFAEGRQNSAGVRCSGENLSGQGWVAKICLVLSIWKLYREVRAVVNHCRTIGALRSLGECWSPPLYFLLCLKLPLPFFNTQCIVVHALGNACFTGLIRTLLMLTRNS